jgi:glucose-1-phosphate cytidylyltransferase
VLSPSVIEYIDNDQTIWEQEPLEKLATEGQLAAYQHRDFWQPMDTLRDQKYLQLSSSGDIFVSKMSFFLTFFSLKARGMRLI